MAFIPVCQTCYRIDPTGFFTYILDEEENIDDLYTWCGECFWEYARMINGTNENPAVSADEVNALFES